MRAAAGVRSRDCPGLGTGPPSVLNQCPPRAPPSSTSGGGAVLPSLTEFKLSAEWTPEVDEGGLPGRSEGQTVRTRPGLRVWGLEQADRGRPAARGTREGQGSLLCGVNALRAAHGHCRGPARQAPVRAGPVWPRSPTPWTPSPSHQQLPGLQQAQSGSLHSGSPARSPGHSTAGIGAEGVCSQGRVWAGGTRVGQGSREGKEHRRQELPLGGLREARLQAEGGLRQGPAALPRSASRL